MKTHKEMMQALLAGETLEFKTYPQSTYTLRWDDVLDEVRDGHDGIEGPVDIWLYNPVAWQIRKAPTMRPMTNLEIAEFLGTPHPDGMIVVRSVDDLEGSWYCNPYITRGTDFSDRVYTTTKDGVLDPNWRKFEVAE